jgi:ABC-type glycerol-3-phosphate transport system substrate-binding protein
MSKLPLALAVSLLGLALASCGSSLTGSSTYSSVTMAVAPNPSAAVKSTDSNYTWQTTVTVTLTSGNSVGSTISAVSASVAESSGGIAIQGSTAPTYRTVVNSTSNRVEGNTTATFTVQMFYTLPNGGQEALVYVAVTITDDAGAVYTLSGTVTAK